MNPVLLPPVLILILPWIALFTVAAGVVLVAWGVISVIRWSRALREIGPFLDGLGPVSHRCPCGGHDTDLDDLVYILCGPCHGKPGPCICTRKCKYPLCGAEDTTSYQALPASEGEWQ